MSKTSNKCSKDNKKDVNIIRIAVIVLAVLVLAVGGIAVYRYMLQNSLKPVGDHSITIGLNGVYDEQGAEARSHGKDVSDKVKIVGSVNSSKPGTYTIEYKFGDMTATRTVKVLGNMNPSITLAGESELQMKLGDSYAEPGFTATDEAGNDITDSVKVSDTEFDRAGTHKISYTAEDAKGNKTRVFRTVDIAPNKNYSTPGLPICMYHYVYDENDPPDDLNKRFGNYISVQDLKEELNWLNEEGYYYPTWREVRDYVDGKQLLPDKSIVLCFDDGAMSFLENGIPVLEECRVPATCFMITSSNGESKIEQFKSDYIYYESHSHNMHRPGGNIGHGGIFTAISEKEGLADLKKSIEICGSGDAFAYPYGDYNDRSRKMVEDAGFLCAVTTQYGKAKPGQDPLLLPRVRMSMGQSMSSFKNKVSP